MFHINGKHNRSALCLYTVQFVVSCPVSAAWPISVAAQQQASLVSVYSAVCHAMSCVCYMAYQCGSTTTGQPCVCIQCGVPCHVLCLLHGLSVWQHNNRPALCLYTVRCAMPCPVSAAWPISVAAQQQASLVSVYSAVCHAMSCVCCMAYQCGNTTTGQPCVCIQCSVPCHVLCLLHGLSVWQHNNRPALCLYTVQCAMPCPVSGAWPISVAAQQQASLVSVYSAVCHAMSCVCCMAYQCGNTTTGQPCVCIQCSVPCHVLCLLHDLSVWQHNNRPALCLYTVRCAMPCPVSATWPISVATQQQASLVSVYSAVCHAMSCVCCMAYQCGNTTTGQPCVCIQCGVPCHVLCLLHDLSVWQHNNRPALCLYTVRCAMPCPVSAAWPISVAAQQQASLVSVYSAVCHAMSCVCCMALQCGSTTTGQPCVCIQCGVPCYVLCLLYGITVWQHNNRPALCLYTVRCAMLCPVSAVWHYSVATQQQASLVSVYSAVCHAMSCVCCMALQCGNTIVSVPLLQDGAVVTWPLARFTKSYKFITPFTMSGWLSR